MLLAGFIAPKDRCYSLGFALNFPGKEALNKVMDSLFINRGKFPVSKLSQWVPISLIEALLRTIGSPIKAPSTVDILSLGNDS
jgi:hypothetical protein